MGIKDTAIGVVSAPGIAVRAGVSAGISQLAGAAKSISWILMLLGAGHWFLKSQTGPTGLTTILSLVLFIIGGFAVASRIEEDSFTVYFPMVMFVVWYFFFGSNYDIRFLAYFVSICVGVLAIFAAITKGKAVKAELMGLIPCVILFLDAGFLEYLMAYKSLPITALTKNLILWMPWWSFLGLWTLPTEQGGKANFLINITRVAGIIWIMFMIVVPSIEGVGYEEKGALPGFDELVASQKSIKDQLSIQLSDCDQKNTMYRWACLFSDPTKVQECTDAKREKCEEEFHCQKVEQLKKGTKAFEDCLKEYQKLKKEGLVQQVSGVIDPTIKLPTKFQFEISEFFPKKTSLLFGELEYPLTLNYENIRNDVPVEFSCKFIHEGKNVSGEIETPKRLLMEGSRSEVITCKPSGKLDGKYTLLYEAKFNDLETESHLTRFFVGNKTVEELEEIKKTIERTEGRGLNYFSASQSPEDPVVLKWGFGGPADNPLIISGKNLFLGLSFSNRGGGELESIDGYEFMLEGFTASCLSRTRIKIPSTTLTRELPIPGCSIKDYPEALKNPFSYEKKTYFARAVYDYKMEKIIAIEVTE